MLERKYTKVLLILVLSFVAELISAQSVEQLLSQEFARYDSIRQAQIGKMYPNFQVVTLVGDTISEKHLKSKVTLLNFWFETCAPCIAEFGELNKLYERLETNSDFQFISFSTDAIEDIKRIIQKYQLRFPVCPISREEAYRLNLNSGFPTNIVIDRTGMIIYLKSGGAVEEKRVKKQIKEIEQLIRNEL